MKKAYTATTALALMLGLAACGGSSSTTSSETKAAEGTTTAAAPAVDATTEAATEEKATDTLTLTVTTSGKGSVSWGIGGSLNTTEMEGEWTETIELTDEFDMVTLSVTGDFMADNNEVKCTITDANGEVVDEASGSGSGALASCSYTDSF